MNTTRRSLVGTCGIGTLALLAGCMGNGGGDTETETTTGTETGTETPTGTESPTDAETETPPGEGTGNETGGTRPEGTGGPGINIASTDDAPDAPVRPSVEVIEDTATEEHPPMLRATVTNESDQAVTLGEGRAIVFAYQYDTEEHLMLLPADEDYPAEAGCWRLTDGIAVTEEYRTVTLEPGESTSQDLGLYGAPTQEDVCLPVGEYRFESTFSVMDEAGGEEQSSFTWGFGVLLE
ncbi:hypothetical protein NDI76_19065 [Halogeometricum sp. S1BR25-6]|uniref:Intracellular proteinase inhibitor BsuPI domain-containing protein n=1 Tax=Halogeometricum salsisoli TaxID=2950536 RepID=A0ABU2GJA2_9EURY|nr:hypothetical protein [Halogeometricum sp. S1BR25-6]MDS0300854.1 hypothetical protein [Halogeometricum sp. S1BR25-6]